MGRIELLWIIEVTPSAYSSVADHEFLDVWKIYTKLEIKFKTIFLKPLPLNTLQKEIKKLGRLRFATVSSDEERKNNEIDCPRK